MTEPRRIVLAGHGMVGARFADDLLRRAEPGSVQVTVFGAEAYQPYNRVLLSEVVAGRADATGLTLPAPDSPYLHARYGTPVRAVDRTARRVLAGGGWHPYDELVLATGASPRIPPIPGLRTGLPRGAHVLRTLDDARELVAAAAVARSATVVGGGVLGLEVACGLLRRGVPVTVLHHGPAPMDRQLDAQAGAVLTTALGRLGAQVLCRASTTAVLTGAGHVQAVVAQVEGRQEHVPTDLLVLACGTTPETTLAAAAGLAVDRGVLVGADLTSRTDPRVHAIGDCAQPPEGASGLVGQGWQQASRLATRLAKPRPRGWLRVTPRRLASRRTHLGTGPTVPPGPTRSEEPVQHGPAGAGPAAGSDVVRLKAAGLDVLTLGPASPPARDGDRTVILSDPTAGRHLAATVRDGLLLAATCIGDPDVAADLTAGYTRRMPAPTDPVHLLVRPLAGGSSASDPAGLPPEATICVCSSVTKAQIVASWRDGARDQEAVARATRATTGCGGCTSKVCDLLDWLGRSGADSDGEKYDIRPKPPVHHAETAAE